MEIPELIEELRRYGLSNGGSLGRHMGIMDLAADALEKMAAEKKDTDEHLKAIGDSLAEQLRRSPSESKVQTNGDCIRDMSDEKLAEMIYDISTNMCCNTVCPKPIHHSNECKPGQVYNCKSRILAWLSRRPEEQK